MRNSVCKSTHAFIKAIGDISYRANNLKVLSIICILGIVAAIFIINDALISVLIVISILLIILSLMNIRLSVLLFLGAMVITPKVNLLNIEGTFIGVRLEDFLLLVIACIGALYFILNRQSIKTPKISRITLCYIGVTFISFVLAVWQGSLASNLVGLLFFFRRIEYFIPMYLVFWLLDQGDIAGMKRMLHVSCFVAFVVALMQAFELVGGYRHGQYLPAGGVEIYATFNGPYEYALFLVIFYSLILADYLWKYNAVSLKSFSLLVFIYYMGLLTAARISIASIFIQNIFAGYFLKRYYKVLILLSALIAVTIFLMPNMLQGKFNSLMGSGNTPLIQEIISSPDETIPGMSNQEYNIDMSTIIRASKWTKILYDFRSYPFFGQGPSAFGEAVDGNYFRLLGENGLVGLFVFIWLVYQVFKRAFEGFRNINRADEVRQYSLFIILVLFALLVNALFVDVFEASKIAMLFWALVGLLYKVTA